MGSIPSREKGDKPDDMELQERGEVPGGEGANLDPKLDMVVKEEKGKEDGADEETQEIMEEEAEGLLQKNGVGVPKVNVAQG